MTILDFFELGLQLDGAIESTYYGQPSVKRDSKVMFVGKDDGRHVSVRLDWEFHDAYLQDFPEIFGKTDHLDGWPWVTVVVENLAVDLATDVVMKSWQSAPIKIKNRPKGFGV